VWCGSKRHPRDSKRRRNRTAPYVGDGGALQGRHICRWRAQAFLAKSMKEIPATPFARLSLSHQQSHLLKIEPEAWPEHLRHAFQIVNERAPQVAEQIVIDAVGAAHRAVRRAYEAQLRKGRSSVLAAFSKNCKTLSNATKPKRLLKAVQVQLDEAARSAFACGFADLETVQQFFAEDAIQQLFSKDESTKECNHALIYEASPPMLRLECESALSQLISEKAKPITAHDVFASLHGASLRCTEMARSERIDDLLQEYLTELDEIWTSYQLKVGRGNHPADSKYRGPFPEFAERVLLSQRHPGSNLFEPPSEQESATVWKKYWELPLEWQKETSSKPFRDASLITDRILRGYLDRRRSSKKSG
jgi:hypothetical protein